MDQQKEIEQLLVPLEALTLEDLNTMDKISRAMSMKRPLSPTTAFPPIPSDNGGLIRHASCTDCNTEAKSIFTAFKALGVEEPRMEVFSSQAALGILNHLVFEVCITNYRVDCLYTGLKAFRDCIC